MGEKTDIVLFGASGFTGSHCIESLHKLTKSKGHKFTWGIAGRSESKIKQALQEYENKIGEDLSAIPVIKADVNDPESLKKMTSSARIIINCCGPYRFYGEAVIKACIETSTHHVDVSGEPQYMEMIQLKYHSAAQEKGIYIVSACGFDSIPADLGVLLLQDKFEGTINSIETYLEFFGGGEGATTNYATYESAVYGISAAKELGKLRRKLFPTAMPKFKPTLKPRPKIHKSGVINKWCIPFMGADRSVIQRTQRYLFEHKIARPIQAHAYVGFSSFYTVMLVVILGTVFSFLAKYKFGRYLLLAYPSFFTAGIVKRETPSKEAHQTTKFSMTFEAKGWNEKLSDVTDEYSTVPNKKMVACLKGNNPGYGLTANCITLAAITILNESDKMPKGGGVYTPGSAFYFTSLKKVIQDNGITFEIL